MYPSLYFRQLGTQVTIPRGYGSKVKIPRWDTPVKTTNGVAGLSGSITAVTESVTEGAIISSFALCAADITGQTVQFAGSRAYSDKLILVTKANFIEGALESLARETSFKIDRYTRKNISASATLRLAANGTVIHSDASLRGKAVARIAPYMDANNVPRWEDNSFVAVVNPAAQFDLYSDISATGWVSVARYGDAVNIYRGEVGQMFGVRFLLSNVIPKVLEAGATSGSSGLSGTVSGSHAWVFAPDAFYSIEIEDGGVEVLHMPPGSSGSVSDPAAQRGSIAVKLHYGVVAAPSADQRLMKFAYALGLRF